MSYHRLESQRSLKGQKWILPVLDERFSLRVAQGLGLSDLVSRILVGRGFDDIKKIERFLAPSLKEQLPNPFVFKGMAEGVERIMRALESGERIMVLGDYDVDGATSTALMIRFFRSLGVEIEFYIPDRFKEGYGPKITIFENFAQKGCKVVLTLDCGTASFEPLEYAQKCGIDVIVIDHHLTSESVPPTCALINPNQPQETLNVKEVYGHLAAVGMSFLFLVGLNQKLREQGWYIKHSRPEPDLRHLLDLVALGTVCDVVPLTGINRVFVAQGLKILNRKQNRGLKALAQVASLEEEVTAYHLGFILGPRINAGGRIGESSLGTRLLSTEDEQEAFSLAMQGETLNRERQEIETSLFKEISNDIEKRYGSPDLMPEVLVVSGEGWHGGVIGIIAGRLKERFHRPTCVISYENGVGKASGRSVTGINLGELIQGAKAKNLLVDGGGHAMAIGFTILQEKEQNLVGYLCEAIRQGGGLDIPHLGVDGILSLKGVNVPFIKSLDTLGPFGMGNSMPRLLLERLHITAPQLVQNAHVRVRLQGEDGTYLEAMAFRAAQTPLGEALLKGRTQRPMDLVGTVRVDTWQGREKVQMIIEDGCFSSERSNLGSLDQGEGLKTA